MATLEELERALRNADKAGDQNAARAIAAEIQKGRSTVGDAKAQFDALPTWKKPVQATADVLRLASNGLTFGFRDKLAQYVGGGSPEEERAATAAASQRAGSAGTAAQIGGAMIPAMAVPSIAPAMSNAVPAGHPILKALAAGTGGALEGSAFGVLDALGHDEDPAAGSAGGAIAGVGGQVLGGLLGKGANAVDDFFNSSERLTVPQLRQMKTNAYQRVDDIGAEITPAGVDDLAAKIDDAVSDAWPTRHQPAIEGAEQSIKALRGDPKTPRPNRSITQIDQTRQGINKNVSNSTDPAIADYGLDMSRAIDDWMGNIDPSVVASKAGSADEAVDALMDARKLNSRMRKLEQLDESMSNASRRANVNLHSGEDSTMRQNINSILSNPRKRRGFSGDELAKMAEVANGTPMQNMLRQVGRMSPGGGLSFGGVGSGAAAGTAIAGPVGGLVGAAIPPAIGALAKKASERSTSRSVEDLLSLVASGGVARGKNPAIDRATQDQMARFFTLMGIQE